MITAKQLVDYALDLHARKAVYWYGTFGVKCSTQLYNSKRKQYPAHYTTARASGYKADIKAGRIVTDCAGLIKGAAWSGGGAHAPKYATGGCPDMNADGLFSWCRSKGMRHGNMDSMPDIPGLLLHMKGHAGVHIGGGYAIEAKGFADDVVKSKVTGRGWTGWAMLPFVVYSAQEELASPVAPPAREPVIVDISQHNGLKAKANDWAKIARNVDLLIIRCGVTRTETKPLGIGIDAEFSYALKMCKKHGIPFGVYYYGKVNSITDARKEARKTWSTASKQQPLFYVYDVEEERLSNAMVEAWMDEMRILGAAKVGLYIAHHLFTRYKQAAQKADFVWVPRYGKNTGKLDLKPAHKCDIHQYTSVGKVQGFADKTLDLNRLTGTKPMSWFLEGGKS